ncbi:MAG: DUF1850 domain-containing protein [Casimicrobiaceae bacterium]
MASWILSAQAACVILAPPDGAPLARIGVDERDPTFRLTYIHSVTRTPVDEVYRVEGLRIVETEIRFDQHGPGLPTAPDAGGTFEHRDGKFVARVNRTFDTIVMRVHADQQPALIAGAQSLDLARWGNRALALTAHAGTCAAP